MSCFHEFTGDLLDERHDLRILQPDVDTGNLPVPAGPNTALDHSNLSKLASASCRIILDQGTSAVTLAGPKTVKVIP